MVHLICVHTNCINTQNTYKLDELSCKIRLHTGKQDKCILKNVDQARQSIGLNVCIPGLKCGFKVFFAQVF